jgi:hypothetical protein
LPRLNSIDQELVGEIAPRIMSFFLDPDLESVSNDLITLGLDSSTAKIVIKESYDFNIIRTKMVSSSNPSRLVFSRAGLNLDVAFKRLLNQDLIGTLQSKIGEFCSC